MFYNMFGVKTQERFHMQRASLRENALDIAGSFFSLKADLQFIFSAPKYAKIKITFLSLIVIHLALEFVFLPTVKCN